MTHVLVGETCFTGQEVHTVPGRCDALQMQYKTLQISVQCEFVCFQKNEDNIELLRKTARLARDLLQATSDHGEVPVTIFCLFSCCRCAIFILGVVSCLPICFSFWPTWLITIHSFLVTAAFGRMWLLIPRFFTEVHGTAVSSARILFVFYAIAFFDIVPSISIIN